MFYSKKHVAYRPTVGGSSIPADKMINDLKDKAVHYIGTYSEYNPIGLTYTGFPHARMAAVVRKHMDIHPKTDLKLPGFNINEHGGGYHGSDFNANGIMRFTKQQLQQLVAAMDTTDELCISVPNPLDTDRFIADVEHITRF
jgi:hypothetical protein